MARFIEACFLSVALSSCGGERFGGSGWEGSDAGSEGGDAPGPDAEPDAAWDADAGDAPDAAEVLVVSVCDSCPPGYKFLNWSLSAACGGCFQANCGVPDAKVLATAGSAEDCAMKFDAQVVAKVVDCNTLADVYICAR